MNDDDKVQVRRLVCAPGMEAFTINGRQWPCDSRWVGVEDAARLIGTDPDALKRGARNGAVPMNFQGWVQLDWTMFVRRLRERKEKDLEDIA